ncbi:hypothetical protein THTE_2304 [Thermogutta terrifontis]|uniref:Uncharacterized protein n=1 Tax=Thermogutta terrifontis TaxID=1331910 RepID=A0A286RG22_9BACT|nr:hypothetical protein THTE_2304 [Thermogutta terrifontis]
MLGKNRYNAQKSGEICQTVRWVQVHFRIHFRTVKLESRFITIVERGDVHDCLRRATRMGGETRQLTVA